MDGLVIQYLESNPERKLSWTSRLAMQYTDLLKKLEEKYKQDTNTDNNTINKTSTIKKSKLLIPLDYQFPTHNVSEEIREILISGGGLKNAQVQELVNILYDDISRFFKE
jgi:hypothetical protein